MDGSESGRLKIRASGGSRQRQNKLFGPAICNSPADSNHGNLNLGTHVVFPDRHIPRLTENKCANLCFIVFIPACFRVDYRVDE